VLGVGFIIRPTREGSFTYAAQGNSEGPSFEKLTAAHDSLDVSPGEKSGRIEDGRYVESRAHRSARGWGDRGSAFRNPRISSWTGPPGVGIF